MTSESTQTRSSIGSHVPISRRDRTERKPSRPNCESVRGSDRSASRNHRGVRRRSSNATYGKALTKTSLALVRMQRVNGVANRGAAYVGFLYQMAVRSGFVFGKIRIELDRHKRCPFKDIPLTKASSWRKGLHTSSGKDHDLPTNGVWYPQR
jgi:hypothetical protein